LITFWQHHKQAIPDSIRIAGGVQGGVYNEFSKELATRISAEHQVSSEILPSGGSLENRERLLSGKVDLAPMQATAISGDQLCVVAPLFYELLYVLAKTDSNIESIGDLRGHRVAIGPPGSGSRATAELVFESLDLTPDLVIRDVIDWQQLFSDELPDAAMVCVGRGSPLISQLMADGRWRIVPIPTGIQISLQHPTLRPMTIQSNELPPEQSHPAGIPTVGTTAFLAACHDTPSELVVAALAALYQEPSPCDGMIPRHRAAEWQGLAFHRAARQYFAELKKQ
jgi:TRAP transporter TAXI family solute receptor